MHDVDSINEEEVKKKRGYLHIAHTFLISNDPKYFSKYEQLYDITMNIDSILPIKVRELIAIALLASRGQYEAMKLHIKRALDNNTSVKEIIESLKIAMFYCGAPSLIYGIEKLIEYLQEINMIDEKTSDR